MLVIFINLHQTFLTSECLAILVKCGLFRRSAKFSIFFIKINFTNKKLLNVLNFFTFLRVFKIFPFRLPQFQYGSPFSFQPGNLRNFWEEKICRVCCSHSAHRKLSGQLQDQRYANKSGVVRSLDDDSATVALYGDESISFPTSSLEIVIPVKNDRVSVFTKTTIQLTIFVLFFQLS